ncbi:hypothetical protein [Nocardia crassostreae]|uniref:hypothetical protein n=1 Tax=Nocardia crassostreae TaxID=53428 RepID=UPI000834B88D|nr:hypothetical protein [Nocardia crassostreae]
MNANPPPRRPVRRATPRRQPSNRAQPTARPAPAAPNPAGDAAAPWWKSPLTWLIRILVLAIGGFLGTQFDTIIGTTLGKPAEKIGRDIIVEDFTQVHDEASNWVLPSGVDPAPLLSDQAVGLDGRLGWLREHGGVAVGSMTWELTIKAERSSAVEVVDIVPVLTEPCGPPLTSGYGYLDEHAAGASDKIVLVTDVSATRPVFDRAGVDSKGDRIDVPAFFSQQRISLPKGERNTISFTTKVNDGHCAWTYRIEYIAESGRESMEISAPGGKPFEATSGTAERTAYDWVVPNPSEACSGVDSTVRPLWDKAELLARSSADVQCWGEP